MLRYVTSCHMSLLLQLLNIFNAVVFIRVSGTLKWLYFLHARKLFRVHLDSLLCL